MGSKVRRVIYMDGELSRDLDAIHEATGVDVSPLVERMAREGVERYFQAMQEVEAVKSASAATVALTLLSVFLTLTGLS